MEESYSTRCGSQEGAPTTRKSLALCPIWKVDALHSDLHALRFFVCAARRSLTSAASLTSSSFALTMVVSTTRSRGVRVAATHAERSMHTSQRVWLRSYARTGLRSPRVLISLLTLCI